MIRSTRRVRGTSSRRDHFIASSARSRALTRELERRAPPRWRVAAREARRRRRAFGARRVGGSWPPFRSCESSRGRDEAVSRGRRSQSRAASRLSRSTSRSARTWSAAGSTMSAQASHDRVLGARARARRLLTRRRLNADRLRPSGPASGATACRSPSAPSCAADRRCRAGAANRRSCRGRGRDAATGAPRRRDAARQRPRRQRRKLIGRQQLATKPHSFRCTGSGVGAATASSSCRRMRSMMSLLADFGLLIVL